MGEWVGDLTDWWAKVRVVHRVDMRTGRISGGFGGGVCGLSGTVWWVDRQGFVYHRGAGVISGCICRASGVGW